MRPVNMLLAIACCLPMAATAADNAIETRKVQAVTMERVLSTPHAFQQVTVRFPAAWIGVTNIYDPQRSHFHPERYINFAVWDDRAPLWDPQVRAKPLASLYMGKDMPGADRPSLLQRYQAVEIEGRIVAIMEGTPWIEVTAVRPLENRGAYTASAISQLEQAVIFAAQEARDLADEHFAAALTADLPTNAQVDIGSLRAQSLIAASRWQPAAEVLRGILPVANADPLRTAAERAVLHAALARCISEAAGDDTAAHTEAVEQAQTAVALDPTLSEAYAVLGVSLAGLGRFDEARLQCDRAVRMRPDDAAVRLALGRILDQQGRHDEAVEALKRAIDLTPKDPRVHRAIASAYLNRAKAGNPADLPIALTECNITLRLDAQDAEAHWLAGQVLEAATAMKVELPLPAGRAVPTRDDAKARYQAGLALDGNSARNAAALRAILDAEAAEAAAAEAAARAEAEAKAAAEAAKVAAEAAKAAAEAQATADANAKAQAEADAKAAAEAEAAARAATEAAAKP